MKKPYKMRMLTAVVLLLLSVNFIKAQALSASISSQTNISCFGACDGSLTGVATGGAGGYTYLWSNASTAPTIAGLCAGTYTLTITDALSATATVSATIMQPTLVTVNVNPQTICMGNSISLCGNVSGGSAPYTFNWAPNPSLSSTTTQCPIASPATTTNYTLTVMDASGCSAFATSTVTVNPNPVPAPYINGLSCDGYPITLFSNTPGGVTYSWVGPNAFSSTTVNPFIASATFVNMGTYTVTATNAMGCVGTGTIYVAINPTPTVTVSSATICATTTATLTANSTGGVGSMVYSWTAGTTPSTGAIVTASPAGTTNYTVTGTDANGCQGNAFATISVNQLPVLNITSDIPNGCSPVCATFSLTSNPAPAATQWSINNGQSSNNLNSCLICFMPAGIYGATVDVTDINGCQNSFTNNSLVTVFGTPVASVTSQVEPGCGNSDGTITGTATGGTPAYTYQWMPGGITTAVVTNLTVGNYTLVVTDMNGCTGNLNYHLLDSCEVVWPGDADNDLTANNYDILDIGLYYGSTGNARPVQGNNWAGYPAENFSLTKPNTYNVKHDDCNGDGTVDASDTTAVILNYNFVHPPYKLMMNTMMGVEIFTEFVLDTVANSNHALMKVKLGTPSNPATNIYGVALTLSFDTTIVAKDSASFNASNSWLATGSPVFLNNKIENYNNGEIDIALSRTNHTNISGNGEIAELDITMKDDISGKIMSNFSKVLYVGISKVKIINANGDTVSYSASGDSLIVEQVTTEIKNPAVAASIKLFPNPAKEFVAVHSTTKDLTGMEIYSLQGKKIDEIKNEQASSEIILNTKNIESGIYLLKVHTLSGIKIVRVQVL